MTRREFFYLTASVFPGIQMAQAFQNSSFVGVPILDRILDKAIANQWQNLPIGDLVGRIGLEFLGTPYVGWTLERDIDREFCFVTLEGLDCVTFFESSLGIALAIKSWTTFERRPAKPQPGNVLVAVTSTRYRDGMVGDYTSRLHYTTDWVFDNAKRGNVMDTTPTFPGAIRETKTIDFMTTHVETYRQLKAHPEVVPKIAAIEAEMTKRGFAYIPTAAVAKIEFRLKTGDIVGLVSKTPGMDINHTGLIVVENGKPLFVHASSTKKKVVKDASISEILAKSSRDIGLIVARPLWN